jgi:DNA polymerase delta subunit 2
MSGLFFGRQDDAKLQVSTQLMMDYLTGLVGGQTEQQLVSKVASVLICGNSLHSEMDSERENESFSDAGLAQLDMMLTQLAATVDVRLMPGRHDPSNFTLPQQPLHKCLFKSAATFKTFTRLTNPAAMNFGDVNVLGTSGENIADMTKYCKAKSDLELLELTLRARNIAPTAPDTLACYPFKKNDPFILNSCPHVYFAANTAKYSTKLLTVPGQHTVRLVTVPKFSKTATIVLLNLKDLSAQPITFSA